ncbi:uncharacterized protein LOC144763920 [Lissotriton helveticus]
MRTEAAWLLVLFPGVYWAAQVGIKEVPGIVGGELIVHCKYPKNLGMRRCYWCKITSRSRRCPFIVWSRRSEKVTEGRFSIKNNHNTNTVTLTMTALRKEDSGLYWCGTMNSGPYARYKITLTLPTPNPNFDRPGMMSTIGMDPPTSSSVPVSSPAPGVLLPSLVTVGVFASLLLASALAWLALRNRRKFLMSENAPKDLGFSLSKGSPGDMMKNPLCLSAEAPEYSVIEHVPLPLIPDHCYEEIFSLYSEAKAPTNRSMGREPTAASGEEHGPCIPAGDSGYSLLMPPMEGRGTQVGMGTSFANLHPQDMVGNRIYATNSVEAKKEMTRHNEMRRASVWVLVLFPGVCWAAGHVIREVYGNVGGTFTIRCNYSIHLVGSRHYWCKTGEWFFCDIIAQSTGSEEEVREGRVSIKDNHKTRSFSMTVRDLTEEDSGLYWCETVGFESDTIYLFEVTVSSYDINFRKIEESLTKKVVIPLVSNSSAIDASWLPWNTLEGSNTTHILSATSSPSTSPFSYLVLQWQVKAALLGIIPLTAVIICIISRKKKKSLDGVGAQADRGCLRNLPPQDVLDDPIYATNYLLFAISPLTVPSAKVNGVFGAAGSDAEEVMGASGGSLTVHCRYAPGFVKYKHYWCKGADWRSCSILVQTAGSEEAVTRGRFTIKDNYTTRTFTVTITGLQEEDSGQYWCGTEIWFNDNMYQVKVTVSKSDAGFH